MGSSEAQKTYPDEKQRYSVALSVWKKSKQSFDIQLNYSVPITESGMFEQDFIIQGTAINSTVTANNHKFLPEELKLSAGTLTGVPLLVDHDNRIESIKGRVIIGEYDEVCSKVNFKAKVVNEDIKSMIKQGLINSVSIGAAVKEIQEAEDGTLTPKGITFKELSLVAVPADAGATFTKAMFEAYKLSASTPKVEEEMVKCKECDKMVEKDKMKAHMDKMHSEEKLDSNLLINHELKGGLNMSENQVTQEQKVEAKVDSNAVMMEMLKTLSAKIESLEKSKEVVKETIVEEEEPTYGKYTIVQGNGSLRGASFTLVRN
jgi:ribosomal protein S26